MTKTTRPGVFIAYARNDTEFMNPLRRHLSALEIEEKAKIFCDRDIQSGECWESEIKGAIRESSVAILLVSTSFFNSKFICETELPLLLAAHRESRIVILPLIVEPCAFNASSISTIQAFNDPLNPLNEMNNKALDKKFIECVEEVKKNLDRLVSFSLPPSVGQSDIFSRDNSSINLKNSGRTFVDEEIFLPNLVKDLPSPCLRDCVFDGCAIFGPAVCNPAGMFTLENCKLSVENAEAMLLPIERRAKLVGIIQLKNCIIRNCSVTHVALALGKHDYNVVEKLLKDDLLHNRKSL